MFDQGTIPAAFTFTGGLITSKGVILASYQRAGAVRTGTVGS